MISVPYSTDGVPRLPRLLVAEDEPLIAEFLVEVLAERGYVIIGPANTLAVALRHAEGNAVDCAVLDVNLAGEVITAVAELLESRRTPFLFVTGYGELPSPHFHRVPVLKKPFVADDLVTTIETLLPEELRAHRRAVRVA